MRHWATVMAAVMLLAVGFVGGCAASGPVGTWTPDLDETVKLASRSGAPESARAVAADPVKLRETLRRNMGDATVSFADDGTFTSSHDGRKSSGSWAMADGVLTITPKGAEPEPAKVRFEGEWMIITVPNSGPGSSGMPRELVLKRK